MYFGYIFVTAGVWFVWEDWRMSLALSVAAAFCFQLERLIQAVLKERSGLRYHVRYEVDGDAKEYGCQTPAEMEEWHRMQRAFWQ